MHARTGRPVREPGSRNGRARAAGRALFLALLLGVLVSTGAAQMQEKVDVQELTGRIEPGQAIIYDLPDMQAGETLYAYAEGTSGNLDPFLAVTNPDFNTSRVRNEFTIEVSNSLASG